jgi:hypothetical protein
MSEEQYSTDTANDLAVANMLRGATFGPVASLTLPSGMTLDSSAANTLVNPDPGGGPVTAKRLTATELRDSLKHATKRIQDLRDQAAEDRDRTSDPTERHGYSREVSAYRLSLDALFAWTEGEFGENFEGGAQ